jgi:hypothetical protein
MMGESSIYLLHELGTNTPCAIAHAQFPPHNVPSIVTFDVLFIYLFIAVIPQFAMPALTNAAAATMATCAPAMMIVPCTALHQATDYGGCTHAMRRCSM